MKPLSKICFFVLIAVIFQAQAEGPLQNLFPEVGPGIDTNDRKLLQKAFSGDNAKIGLSGSSKGLIYTRDVELSENMKGKERLHVEYTNHIRNKIKRVTLVRDSSRSGPYHSGVELKTATVSDGKIGSFTECGYHVSRDVTHEQREAREKLERREAFRSQSMRSLLNYIRVGPKARREDIWGGCYTVSGAICDGIEKKFSDVNLKKLFRKCQDFAKDIQDATSHRDSYFHDESAAKRNVNYLFDQYAKMHPPQASKRYKIADMYDNLKRGERAKPAWQLVTVGKMIDLCKKVEFHKPIVSGLATPAPATSRQ